MSFDNTCANIWNFNLTQTDRKRVLEGADFARIELDLTNSDINNASNRGWKNMLNWIKAGKSERDSICESLMRLFI